MRGVTGIRGAVARRCAIVLAAASLALIGVGTAASADTPVADSPFALPTAPNAGPSYILEVCASVPDAAYFAVQGYNQFGKTSSGLWGLVQTLDYNGQSMKCGWTAAGVWWWWQPTFPGADQSFSAPDGAPRIIFYDSNFTGISAGTTPLAELPAFRGTNGWYLDSGPDANGIAGASGTYVCFLTDVAQPSC